MLCSVPFCYNSREAPAKPGVTYHKFPREAGLRVRWCEALNRDVASLPARAAVCSLHFSSDDFYVTRAGVRKVKAGAVPLVVHVCLICLDIERKMFPLNKYQLTEPYTRLTGVALEDGHKLPSTLCGECAHRLMTFNRFRQKSVRAHALMMDLVKRNEYITIQNIKSIDRYGNKLISDIQEKIFPPDTYDLVLYDAENTTLLADESGPDYKYSVIVKDENLINTDENCIESKETILCQENLMTEDVNNVNEAVNKIDDQYNDNGVNSDTDYIPNIDGYSTDDSLPLETKRKKLKNDKSDATNNGLVETKRKKIKKREKNKKEQNVPKVDRRRRPFLNDDLNETLFTITDLSFEEQIADIEKRRDSANYKNSRFKCTLCYKGFLDEEAYNGHMSRHTVQCGEHECEICKTHFKHAHALRKHITAHHTQRFSCNCCPYVTTHRQTARLHERWHKGTKYQCPHCPDEFVKFTTYMGHIRIKHPSDFVCALCGYSFVSEKGIDLHKKLKHRLDDTQIPEDGPLCDLCNVRFVSDAAYKRHRQVSAKHATDKPRGRKPREPKERGSAERNERRLHPSRLRRAEGPISCEQCGIELEDSRAYHGHFRRQHPDKNRTMYPSMKSPFMCESCGRMFQSYALLKDHRWVHTGERPFACESCGKSFRMKQRLVAHRRVHSQSRATYACALCGKGFSTHSNRQRHMVIHTGLKPFKCEMCGKCFKHSSEKRAHVTYVHLKKPWPKRARGKRRADRPGQLQPACAAPAGASEMELPQQWACEPKHHMPLMDDKPLYYNNIKI